MTVEAPALSRLSSARYDRQFYTGMAIAAAVVVFLGFAPTFFLRGSYQTTPLPTYLQVTKAMWPRISHREASEMAS